MREASSRRGPLTSISSPRRRLGFDLDPLGQTRQSSSSHGRIGACSLDIPDISPSFLALRPLLCRAFSQRVTWFSMASS